MRQYLKNLSKFRWFGSGLGLKLFSTVLIVSFISLFAFEIKPLTVQAANTGDLLDRTIQWADGSTEHVQIGNDAVIRLDGNSRYLLGMCMGGSAYTGYYFDPANLALIDKEVSYLQSVGVRTIELLLVYEGPYQKESERYKPVLDIMYKHKMLVMPLFTLKWVKGFGNLQNPDIPLDGDTLSGLVSRWCSVVSSYPNVTAIYVENELDLRVNGQTYDGAAAGAYMKLLTGLFRQNVDLPLLTKVMGYFPGGVIDQIKEAILPTVDIPAFDIYQSDAAKMGGIIDRTNTWLITRDYAPKRWWAGEYNASDANNRTVASRLNSSFLDATFSRSVPIVHMWPAHRVQEPTAAFFDLDGKPIPALVTMAQDFSRFQVPLSQPTLPLSVATLAASSIDATTATLNASLTGLGTSGSVSASFDFGMNTTYGQTVVATPSTLTSAGKFNAVLTGLTPGTTYHYQAKAVGDGTAEGVDFSFTTLEIKDLAVLTNSLPAATVGVAYSQNIAATGGIAPYSWTLISGILPKGLVFSSGGIISGKPTEECRPVSLVLSVKDSVNNMATKSLTITVSYQSWDINKDGAVDVLDMILISQRLGESGTNGWIREDVNDDGSVNMLDSILVGQHWAP
jgi:hypothetical protein